ncbi:MAG: Fur-regulated basic protein FbpA [Bacillota bacterium]
MKTTIHGAAESRKNKLIEKLDMGIYRTAEGQLYELCETKLEKEFSDRMQRKGNNG